ncbi:MAG: hypothetical protein GY940_37285, partial [bacterium]|nr:hypothetical protein [bacterium]
MLMLLLIPLEIFLLKVFYPPTSRGGRPANSSRPFIIQADKPYYTGASVNTAPASSTTGFSYTPASDYWFKLIYADNYNKEKGFLQAEPPDGSSTVPRLITGAQAIRIQMQVLEQGIYFLPQPVGYGIDPGTITLDLNRVSPGSFQYRRSGEA